MLLLLNIFVCSSSHACFGDHFILNPVHLDVQVTRCLNETQEPIDLDIKLPETMVGQNMVLAFDVIFLFI